MRTQGSAGIALYSSDGASKAANRNVKWHATNKIICTLNDIAMLPT